MIQISHKQAQRLLRSHLDTRLPNEQWLMLQAHLETCETCRTANERLVGLEKSLKRSLRAGWDGAHGPAADTDQQVVAGLLARARLRKRLLATGAAAVLILLVTLLGGPAGIRARFIAAGPGQLGAAGVPAASLTPAVEATELAYQPTVEPGQFAEVIAYEGRRDALPNGDHEIYLLNPGSASVNLTNHPAQDTDPAWSPDGEWLAFLSDRNQKPELYVTNITGNRVVQLTDEAGISWQGPLSWSPDGKWISLGGTRTQQGGQNWIYQVSLNGTGVRALPGSRGGDSPKYSPNGRQIAYRFIQGDYEGIIVQDLDSGDQVTSKWRENPLVPPPAAGSAFDWSPDGAGLAFVSAMPNPVANANQPTWDGPPPSGEPGSQVLAVRRTNSRTPTLAFPDIHYPIDQSRWPGAFRAVTWSPSGAVVYLEDLGDARANDKPGTQPIGCWTLQVSETDFSRQPNQNAARQTSFGGLCVEGSLDSTSWTVDGRWVVVQGRLPSENQRSIYALRMPGGAGRTRRFPSTTPTPNRQPPNQVDPTAAPVPGTILRLSDDPWAGPLPSPRPRRSALGFYPQIDPQPVKEPAASLPPSNLSLANSTGQILYVVPNRTMSVVASANPDGTGGRVLLASPGLNRCPTWSPDGNAIALVQASTTDPASSIGAGEDWQFGEPPAGDAPAGASTVTPGDAAGESAPSQPGIENIYVLNPNTGGLRQVSRPETIPVSGLEPDQVSYGCPVWSPGGPSGERFLAALVSDGRKTFLAVLPASLPDPASDDPAPRPRYLSVNAPDWSLPPVWSPDGETIFLLHSETSGAGPGTTVVTVPADAQSRLASTARPPSWQPQTAPALAILPSGKALLQLDVFGSPGSAHLHRIVYPTEGGSYEVGPAVYLETRHSAAQTQGAQALSGNMTWLYGSTFGVTLRTSAQDMFKTRFYLYSMGGDRVQAVAAVEDRVNSAAWSPDGRWLMYSAESGLWGVDIQAVEQGRAGPVWLSPQPVQDLDWK